MRRALYFLIAAAALFDLALCFWLSRILGSQWPMLLAMAGIPGLVIFSFKIVDRIAD